jgi:hypothetical protein
MIAFIRFKELMEDASDATKEDIVAACKQLMDRLSEA